MSVSVNILNHHVKYNVTTTDLYLPVVLDSSSDIGSTGSSTSLLYLFLKDETEVTLNRLKAKTSVSDTFKYYLYSNSSTISTVVDDGNRQFTFTVADGSVFSVGDSVTIVNNAYADNDDLSLNGNLMYVSAKSGNDITVIANLDTSDYTLLTTGTLYKLFKNTYSRSDFFEISNSQLVDYNLFIDMFWEASVDSLLSFDSFMIFSSEILNVGDITDGGDFSYYYDESGVFMSETSREIAFRRSEYGDIYPSIFINDVEGTGNSLPFSNNYKFSYEFNVSSLDSSTSASRNEASISGNYIDNILEFAESFSLKAIGDIYEYIAMLNIRSAVYEKNNSLIIESPAKTNKMIISKENNNKYIVVKNEDGVFFDSRKFIKVTDLSENMGIVFDNLKTKEVKLFNNVETEVGYIKVTGEGDNILELSADNNKIQFIDNSDTNVTQFSSSNGKLEILDDFIVHDFNIQNENNEDYVIFTDNSATFKLKDNKPNNNNSFFKVKSIDNNFDFIQATVIDGIDITSIGKFNVLTAYDNLIKDTWLVDSIENISNTGILVSSNKSFIKINTENNMEMAGKDTLYIKFKNIILDGVVSFTRQEEVNDSIVYSNKKNLMTQDSSIYFYDGIDGYYNKHIFNKDGLSLINKDGGSSSDIIMKPNSIILTRSTSGGTVFGTVSLTTQASDVKGNAVLRAYYKSTLGTAEEYETVYGPEGISYREGSNSLIDLVPIDITINSTNYVILAYAGSLP